MKNLKNKLQGFISISSKGTGYVAIPELKEDPEIDFKHLNTALHGDLVEIILHPKSKGRSASANPRYAKGYGEARGYGETRQTAEVSKIIARAKTGFAGVLETSPDLRPPSPDRRGAGGEVLFLKPDDTKMYTDILIPKENLNNAKIGQKVFAKIISWPEASQMPLGQVVRILGQPGENDAEMRAIAMEKGFDSEFPESVEKEAEKISVSGEEKNDYSGRRDFRKILTFTIDPEDAKDFDDAISFRILPSLNKEGVGGGNSKTPSKISPLSGGEVLNHHLAFGTPPQQGGEEFEIGIHIADVSHYVKLGSRLDEEARERGTSVYLVDRTIPMLPEILSNDLCSLVPNKDRLTMSAVFIIDKNAKIKSEWYGRAVICSQKRFSYEEAEEAIKIASSAIRRGGGKHSDLFQEALFILNNLAKKLTTERFKNGAISLDQEEVKFVLDKNGFPIKVIKKERGDSSRLIEEFMLLANKKVAEVLSPKKNKIKDESVSLFRVHDLPSKEKMADLAFFLRGLGHQISLRNGIISNYEINSLLKKLSGKNEEDTVQRAVIRSMAKAIYSTKNIGHYGLAFEYYTHFTSPIRRYPDIVIHRLLSDYLARKKIGGERLAEYEKIARISSEQEKRAADAERASIKYKQVEYMGKRLGQKFEGIISGITEWGLYVEEIETKCEGLARMRDLSDDFYVFNEKKLELVGQKRKNKYRLGDRVKIKVKSVDLERKTIDYVLI